MLHDGATVVGARVVVGACVATGALVVVVTRAVVGDGLEDWVSVAQLAMRREITNGVAQLFMSPVFQTRYAFNCDGYGRPRRIEGITGGQRVCNAINHFMN